MNVKQAKDLVTVHDYDMAIAATRPMDAATRAGRQIAFAELADLHLARAKLWSELAARHAHDVRVPPELVAAAHQCSVADQKQAREWVKAAERALRR